MPPYALFERYRPVVDDWEAFVASLARPLPTCVWANTLRTTPARLAEWLAGEGLATEPIAWYPGGFRLDAEARPAATLPFLGGLFHLQEEVSLLPPVLLAPQPGERVLDLCAAPGGKTAQLAVAMQNRGTLVANDLNHYRMRVLRGTLTRLGLLNVTTTNTDAAAFPGEGGSYDRVLADVPCSCEGTCRKNPGALTQVSPEFIRQMSGVQRAILENAVCLCKPGGRIVYATCTFAPEENELVVDDVLRASEGQLRLLPARIDGFAASPGLTAWQGRALHPSLENAMRVWPHQNDTGGFFVAVLEKEG